MKKVLPAAVLAAMAGVNGAQAVHVNSDGLGQVLLFPYYTVEDSQNTYIQVVNTTDQYKAVKIRFLESMNSKEVLDFNIYLSPKDHWSAEVAPDAGGGAALTSQDASCTVPNAVSKGQTIPFRDILYAGDSVKGVARTREGYVEVLEMGTVTDPTLQAAILHNAEGKPGNCALLEARWSTSPVGAWVTDPNAGMGAIGGGLYGYGVLINVDKGTDASYDAVAIGNWADSLIIHTNPGNTLPSLTSDSTDLFEVFTDGGFIAGQAISGEDAVSITMMHSAIANDYVLEKDFQGGTDWVVTFPTKNPYVDLGYDNSTPPQLIPALPPFTKPWDPTKSQACETFDIVYWNREEKRPQTITPVDFSPKPEDEPDTFTFCHEANVLTFNNSNVLSASARTGVNLDLDDGFENGWARIDFTGPGRSLLAFDFVTQEEVRFNGLPTIGFAVQRYVNGDVDGLLANYAGADLHKNEILITSN